MNNNNHLQLELGLTAPHLFRRQFYTRALLSLDLSPHWALERVHQGSVHAMDVELQDLLSAGSDGAIALFDLNSADPLSESSSLAPTGNRLMRPLAFNASAHRYAVSAVAWYPFDTGMFVSGSMDHTVNVWDTNSMRSAYRFDLDEHVYAVSMSPLARQHSLICCGTASHKVRLCDLRTGSAAQMLSGHREAVLCTAWSPTNDYVVATGSQDRSVRVWDIRKAGAHQCLAQLDMYRSEYTAHNRPHATDGFAHEAAVNGLVFTDDGRYLVTSGNDHRVRLWQTDGYFNTMVNYGTAIRNKSRQRVQLAVTNLRWGPVTPLVFYPNDDGSICVFDMYAGRLMKRMSGHFDKVNCVVLRLDTGVDMYSGGNDHEILSWSPRFQAGRVDERMDPAFMDSWSDEGEALFEDDDFFK